MAIINDNHSGPGGKPSSQSQSERMSTNLDGVFNQLKKVGSGLNTVADSLKNKATPDLENQLRDVLGPYAKGYNLIKTTSQKTTQVLQNLYKNSIENSKLKKEEEIYYKNANTPTAIYTQDINATSFYGKLLTGFKNQFQLFKDFSNIKSKDIELYNETNDNLSQLVVNSNKQLSDNTMYEKLKLKNQELFYKDQKTMNENNQSKLSKFTDMFLFNNKKLLDSENNSAELEETEKSNSFLQKIYDLLAWDVRQSALEIPEGERIKKGESSDFLTGAGITLAAAALAVNVFVDGVNGFILSLRNAPTMIMNAGRSIGMFLKGLTIFKEGGKAAKILGVVTNYTSKFTGFISGILPKFTGFFKILGWPLTMLLGIMDFAKGFMTTEGTTVDKIFGGFQSAIMGIIEFPLRAIGWISEKLLGLFGVKTTEIGDQLFGFVDNALSGILSFIKAPFNYFFSYGPEKIEEINTQVSSIFTSIGAGFGSFFTSLKEKALGWLKKLDVFGLFSEENNEIFSKLKEPNNTKETSIMDSVSNWFNSDDKTIPSDEVKESTTRITNTKANMQNQSIEGINSLQTSMKDLKNELSNGNKGMINAIASNNTNVNTIQQNRNEQPIPETIDDLLIATKIIFD